MVHFTASPFIIFASIISTASAALLKDGTYRISCDPLRPTPISATAPGRRFLAINSPNADATFSRYVNEAKSPQWKVKRDPVGIEYTIESLRQRTARVCHSRTELAVIAKIAKSQLGGSTRL